MMNLAWIYVYYLIGLLVIVVILEDTSDTVFVMAFIWPLLLILTLLAIIWKYCIGLLEWIKEKK